jgi:hypothetical protein
MGLKIFHSATMYALPDASTGVDPSTWFRIIGYDTCFCFFMSRRNMPPDLSLDEQGSD